MSQGIGGRGPEGGSEGPTKLFLSEYPHGIGPHGGPGRHPAGDDANEKEHRRRSRKRCWIHRLQAEESGLEQARQAHRTGNPE